MSAPTTVNPTATKADDIIVELKKVLTPLIQKLIQTEVPALALPVVEQLTDGIEDLVANYITKYVELGATDVIIDGQTDSEEDSVSSDIKNILADEKSGDQNALTTDEAKLKTDQSALISDDGSATPQ